MIHAHDVYEAVPSRKGVERGDIKSPIFDHELHFHTFLVARGLYFHKNASSMAYIRDKIQNSIKPIFSFC
jgi:hypothetical protein